MIVARDRDSLQEFGLLVGSLQLRFLEGYQVEVDRERDENADPLLPGARVKLALCLGCQGEACIVSGVPG
jgi:hypothetical protein